MPVSEMMSSLITKNPIQFAKPSLPQVCAKQWGRGLRIILEPLRIYLGGGLQWQPYVNYKHDVIAREPNKLTKAQFKVFGYMCTSKSTTLKSEELAFKIAVCDICRTLFTNPNKIYQTSWNIPKPLCSMQGNVFDGFGINHKFFCKYI